jgi:hypothetical protein
MSRGLDSQEITVVINYDAPPFLKARLHRTLSMSFCYLCRDTICRRFYKFSCKPSTLFFRGVALRQSQYENVGFSVCLSVVESLIFARRLLIFLFSRTLFFPTPSSDDRKCLCQLFDSLQTYVHRVGRTARAGRAGTCYSLLRKEEARFFKQMLLRAENSKQHEIKLDSRAVVKPVERYYQAALQKLSDTLDAERLAGAAGDSPSQNQTSNTQNKTKNPSGHSQTPQKAKDRAADADAEKTMIARKGSAKHISQGLRAALSGQ